MSTKASANKILLILGSGGRVGASVASLFSQKGWSVAIAARSLVDNKVNDQGHLQLRVDLGKSDTIAPAFDKVKEQFGNWPNSVVYNAAAAHFVPATSPLDLSASDLEEDFVVNTSSVLIAAQQALAGWSQLPAGSNKSFIVTGNFLNKEIMPALLSNGIGKSATAHLVRVAHEAYGNKGYRFYYADERTESGFAAFRDVSGPAHAEHFLTLAESKESLPWLQTFVGGKGYVDFANI